MCTSSIIHICIPEYYDQVPLSDRKCKLTQERRAVKSQDCSTFLLEQCCPSTLLTGMDETWAYRNKKLLVILERRKNAKTKGSPFTSPIRPYKRSNCSIDCTSRNVAFPYTNIWVYISRRYFPAALQQTFLQLVFVLLQNFPLKVVAQYIPNITYSNKSTYANNDLRDFQISSIRLLFEETNGQIGKNGNLIEEFTDFPRQINLEVNSDDIQELLSFHNQKLTIDELIEVHVIEEV
ncbi:hypothetical protein TNCV_2734871 [Trichonephila clavipes]|nr:hypothetical protein TNCV_2734871 [Trichonephila clavipes]